MSIPQSGPGSRLERLIYVSKAVSSMSRDDLEDLARQTSLDNEAIGITGVLLYGRRHFVHCLEGHGVAIQETYGAIFRDSRHTSINILYRKVVKSRLFLEWSMGLLSLEDCREEPLIFQALALRTFVETLPKFDDRAVVVGLLQTLRRHMSA